MSGSLKKGEVGIGTVCRSRKSLACSDEVAQELTLRYNVTPSAAYQWAPAYRRFGHKINAVHFIGPNKPWSNAHGRPAGMSRPSGEEPVFDCE
jgi:hypothetical protein